MMYGSLHDEYTRIAPTLTLHKKLFEKKTRIDRQIKDIPEETIRAIKAPTLILLGDSDLVRPEHAVEMSGCSVGEFLGICRLACRIHNLPCYRAHPMLRFWTAPIGWSR